MKDKIRIVVQLIAIAAAGHLLAYQICNVPKQIELVALLAIALLYPIIRFPIVGVYAFFIISPFIPFIRRLYYLAHGRPGMDPLIVIGDIIIVMVFLGLFFEFRQRRLENSTSKYFMMVILFYILYMVLRTFAFNISPLAESLGKLKYYAPPVLLFFIGVLYARKETHLKRLWGLTIFIALLSCLYGFKQLYIGYSGAERLWFSSINFTTLFIKGIARPFSIFQSPAGFADYLLLGIIAILILYSWSSFKGKQALMIFIPLYFYGILITSVRSNWIGAGAVLIGWFVVFKMKNNAQRIAVIACAGLFFFLYQFVDDSMKSNIGLEGINNVMGGKLGKQEYIDLMVTSRAKAITNPFEEHSMLSRIALWKYMIILSTDPEMALLGRGLGALNADSLYITYLAEFGYPGFIFIVVLMVVFIIRGIRMIDTRSNEPIMALVKGIVCMDLAFSLMNFTGTHIHAFPGDAYFWFFNGVLIGISPFSKKIAGENGIS
jgi:putative inorganic carbon (hco3(-)) transporter